MFDNNDLPSQQMLYQILQGSFVRLHYEMRSLSFAQSCYFRVENQLLEANGKHQIIPGALMIHNDHISSLVHQDDNSWRAMCEGQFKFIHLLEPRDNFLPRHVNLLHEIGLPGEMNELLDSNFSFNHFGSTSTSGIACISFLRDKGEVSIRLIPTSCLAFDSQFGVRKVDFFLWNSHNWTAYHNRFPVTSGQLEVI